MKLLTVKDVAERLQLSQGWVRDHATRFHPRLESVQIGAAGGKKKLRFRPEAVDRFIQEHIVNPSEQRV